MDPIKESWMITILRVLSERECKIFAMLFLRLVEIWEEGWICEGNLIDGLGLLLGVGDSWR